jgi:hypothetical protein
VLAIGAAMALLLLMFALLHTVLDRGSRLATDAVTTQDQTAALFLAESGIERAHGVLTRAAAQGTSLVTACRSLAQTGDVALGAGQFRYRAVSDTEESCPGNRGACRYCSFLIEGQRGSALRTLQAKFDISNMNGVTGIGDRSEPLVLKVEQDGAAALLNVAFVTRYSTDSATDSANASLAECLAGAGAITSCTRSWDDINPGNEKVTGSGVLANNLTEGSYRIEAGFRGGPSTYPPLPRPYALTGALLYPMDGGVVTEQGKTAVVRPTDTPLNFSVPDCTATTAFPDIDTAIYGFSSIREASESQQLTQIAVASSGQAPHMQLHRLLHRDSPPFVAGGIDHRLYSQFWYAYNPAFRLASGTATGAAGSSTVAFSSLSQALPRVGTVLSRPGAAAFPVLSLVVDAEGTEVVDATQSLQVGDAVFGAVFPLDTHVVAHLGGGRYQLSLTDVVNPVSALPVVVRSRVVAVDTLTGRASLSRPLVAPLTAGPGELCGGLCALIHNAAGVADFRFVLSGPGLTDSTKWASGYACFSGVDPDRRIRPIHGLPKRTLWAEVIQ